MAAQNLAAILIQKRVRGMLCRKHLEKDIHWRPSHMLRRRLASSNTFRRLVQSPMQRFIHSGKGRFDDEEGFRQFTATRIQAWYKKERLRWRYDQLRYPMYHIAALEIQFAWRAHCYSNIIDQSDLKRSLHHDMSLHSRAALVIQTAWKAYTNLRIYRYYRDLISFRSTGDPAMMLRAINPVEATLLDATMGAHVRFRLGGVSFPPTIYYKIFTRKPVCDIGAFSPKEYTISREIGLKHSHQSKSKRNPSSSSLLYIRVGTSYFRARQISEDTCNWYKRIENNGWRPVTAKVLSEANKDPIAKSTAQKAIVGFHHSRTIPKKDMEKRRREKKRQWMRNLYAQGLLKEMGRKEKLDDPTNEQQYEIDFESENWEEDADEMFDWASGLDYDEYIEGWYDVGKTGSTDDDTRLFVER